jgi:MFS family permease
VLAAAPSLAVALPLSMLVGLSSIAFMTSSTALVQLRADPTMRGRVLAIQAMVFLGSTPIGGPILGAICERFGARMGLVVGGVSCVVAALWGFAASRSELVQRRPGEEEPLLADAAEADQGLGLVPRT